MTKGGIQNTHYNIIDTLRTFIPSNTWFEYVSAIIPFVEKSTSEFIDDNKEIVRSSVMILSQAEAISKAIPYSLPIRYTICECVVWAYFNGGYNLT